MPGGAITAEGVLSGQRLNRSQGHSSALRERCQARGDFVADLLVVGDIAVVIVANLVDRSVDEAPFAIGVRAWKGDRAPEVVDGSGTDVGATPGGCGGADLQADRA
jgi:hypothetical protein